MPSQVKPAGIMGIQASGGEACSTSKCVARPASYCASLLGRRSVHRDQNHASRSRRGLRRSDACIESISVANDFPYARPPSGADRDIFVEVRAQEHLKSEELFRRSVARIKIALRRLHISPPSGDARSFAEHVLCARKDPHVPNRESAPQTSRLLDSACILLACPAGDKKCCLKKDTPAHHRKHRGGVRIKAEPRVQLNHAPLPSTILLLHLAAVSERIALPVGLVGDGAATYLTAKILHFRLVVRTYTETYAIFLTTCAPTERTLPPSGA